MKRIFTLYLFLGLTIVPAWAETPEANNIRMFLDFARFRYDQDNTYLEIYYLLYDTRADSLRRPQKIWLDFSLFDTEKDSTLASAQLHVTMDPQSSDNHGLKGSQGSLIKTVLPVGKYKMKMVRLDDTKTQKLDSVAYEFSTTSFKNERVALSDLELSCNIIPGSQNSEALFYKNTMEVYPNPMSMYGPQTPDLYYYIELYNVQSDNPRDELNIKVAIADKEGNIRAEKHYSRKRTYESLVEVGKFDVSEFENGPYAVIFAAIDSTSNYSVYTRDNFYIMDAADWDRDLTAKFIRSIFFEMPEEELNEKFEQLQYLTTSKEREVYKSLDTIDSKRMYLFSFWTERQGYQTGLMEEYYSRIEIANANFPYANIVGWKSDRGRIYVTYGPPDQITRRPHNPDVRPYVVWFYHELEGGAKFLFVDESGFGDYKLKSSTLRGEIYDPEWSQLLLTEQ